MNVAVIDVGNTSTGIALYARGKVSRVAHIKGGILKSGKACADALRGLAYGKSPLDGVALASVVPPALAAWKRLVKRELNLVPLVVDATLPLPVTVDYPAPATIGADRLADAAGGVARYGAPLLICDFGTALTFDVVTPDRRYVGGAICPGIPLMSDYLNERTAKLPRVEFKGTAPKIGRSTEEAMRLGAAVGYRGMVRELTEHFRQTLGFPFTFVATGGYARWALKDSGLDFIIDPALTLYGLGVIWDYSRQRERSETP